MMDNVEIFPWNENFATGIPLIDEQHKILIDLLNLLVSHLAYQSDVPTINAIFDRLREYAAVHFKDEGAIWAKHFGNDSWAERHRQAHGDFIAEIVKLKEEESTRPLDEVIEEIVKFLTHWLAYHILESDKRMAKVVLALPGGMSLEHAKEMANEEMAGAGRILIDTVMTMYDQLANRTVMLTREIAKRKKIEWDLQLAKEKADAASISKSTFLSHMSHEIRTPLNAITGMVHIMRREGITPTQEERLAQIDQACKHLLSVINDVLDLSKIEAGKFDLEEKEVVVESLVENVASILSDRARDKHLSLVVANDTFPQHLLGDSTRLQQALLNFAGNAIKFTDRGSITLRTQKAEENHDSVLVRFEVRDSGVGIDQSILKRLFNAFEQADNSMTRKHGGTGLGLVITKDLAELMGGTAGAESTPGLGSTFWFTARLKKGGPPLGEAAPGSFPELVLNRDFSGSRILLAEDELINREVSRMILEDIGMIVDCAEDGEEAVAMASRSDYVLIMMDMQMPRMDGLEATRQIRKLARYRDVPILAMTGNAFNEDRQRCLEAGMNEFLTKPVMPDILFATLLKLFLHQDSPQ